MVFGRVTLALPQGNSDSCVGFEGGGVFTCETNHNEINNKRLRGDGGVARRIVTERKFERVT